MSNVFFGIDLGTSQCSVAYIVDSPRIRQQRVIEPKVVRIRRQEASAAEPSDRFPSMIGIDFADQGRLRLLFGWDFGLPQNDDNVLALRLYSRWLREHFSLEPIYEQGQVLDVPQGRLSAFDLIGECGHSRSAVCSVKIVAAGWKQGSTVLRKPVASIIDGAASGF